MPNSDEIFAGVIDTAFDDDSTFVFGVVGLLDDFVVPSIVDLVLVVVVVVWGEGVGCC